MNVTPLFLGLTRPPKFFGLPLGYFVGLAMVSTIPFIVTSDLRFLLIFLLGYPPLWLIADRNPNFFEVVSVVTSNTPRTRRRAVNEGDVYVS